MSEQPGFQCSVCGEFHAELPLAYGPKAPADYFVIPEEELESRAALSTDLCLLDEEHCFICGNIELPIQESDKIFSWDVWVSVTREDFQKTLDLWESEERQNAPPIFGLIANTLPGYSETQNLRVAIHSREVGRKPFLQLEPTDHALAIEQREGISPQRIKAIAEMVLHPED